MTQPLSSLRAISGAAQCDVFFPVSLLIWRNCLKVLKLSAQGLPQSWISLEQAVVNSACRPCNHRKSHRTPEQAHMPLLYAPYVPSLWEDFILRNRRILADQMEFLMSHVPRSSRLLS